MKIQIAVSGIREKRTVLQSWQIPEEKKYTKGNIMAIYWIPRTNGKFLVKDIGFLINILLLKNKRKQYKDSLMSGGMSS